MNGNSHMVCVCGSLQRTLLGCHQRACPEHLLVTGSDCGQVVQDTLIQMRLQFANERAEHDVSLCDGVQAVWRQVQRKSCNAHYLINSRVQTVATTNKWPNGLVHTINDNKSCGTRRRSEVSRVIMYLLFLNYCLYLSTSFSGHSEYLQNLHRTCGVETLQRRWESFLLCFLAVLPLLLRNPAN